jgi:hypothetical protein
MHHDAKASLSTNLLQVTLILEASLAHLAPVNSPMTETVHVEASLLESVKPQVASFALVLRNPNAAVLDVLVVLIFVVELHFTDLAFKGFRPMRESIHVPTTSVV